MVTHEPTAEEQLLLEQINRARLDPAGELDHLIVDAEDQTGVQANITGSLRFFNVDVDQLYAQLNGVPAVAPLAWNSALAQSADTHSQLMIDFDEQSHNLPNEPTLGNRVQLAGYDNLTTVSENVFAFTDDPVFGHAGFYIDWGYDVEDILITNEGTENETRTLRSNWASLGDGIQDPPGHRNAILRDSVTEIGISLIEVTDNSLDVGPNVMTQHIANRWDYDPQLVGVVIDDADGDDFYDVGEGMGGVTVTAVSASGGPEFVTTTWASGGYQMVLPDGVYTVTFSGGGLSGVVVTTVTVDGENVKADAIADEAVDDPNAPTEGDDMLSGTNGNDSIDLLGGDDVYDAGSGSDIVIGGTGDDTLNGEAGNDTLAPGLGTDVADGGEGRDLVDYSGVAERVLVDLAQDVSGAGFARFFGEGAGAGDQFIGIEDAMGGEAADNLRGDGDGNTLHGGGVSDRLYGRAGDDTLDGGTGADALYGNLGADVMTGGDDAGRRDRFIYFQADESGVGAGNRDVITDFAAGEDRIELSRIDANTGIGGKQRFDFVGDAAFSGTAGELRYEQSGGTTLVQADRDGDGIADFEIELQGTVDLSASDFLI